MDETIFHWQTERDWNIMQKGLEKLEDWSKWNEIEYEINDHSLSIWQEYFLQIHAHESK